MNNYLAGDAPELAASTLTDLVLGRPKKGGHVITTIDAHAAARRRRGARHPARRGRGARPARPATSWRWCSNPTLRPERAVARAPADEMQAAWKRLNADPDKPLLSRANDELFLPGSTFKMVTASRGARERLRARQHLAEPPRARPAAHDRHHPELRRRVLPGRRDRRSRWPHAFTRVLQRHLRRDRPEARAPTSWPARRTRTGSARPTRRGRPRASSRRSRSSIPFADGPLPGAVLLRAATIRSLALSAIGQDNDLTNPLQMALVARRDRERRHDDAAPARDARSATRRAGRSGVRPAGVRPAHLTADRRRHCAQMMVNVVDERDRHRRADPAARSWRARPGPRTQRRPAAARTRGSSASRRRGRTRPRDRGRGYRPGRRRPRERGDRRPGRRADREAGHRGVPGPRLREGAG